MAIFSLWLIEAERQSDRWRHSPKKRRRFITMGAGGMMADANRRLSKILKRQTDDKLEGGGVLLKAKELAAFFLKTPNPNKKFIKWSTSINEKRRFFLFAKEECYSAES